MTLETFYLICFIAGFLFSVFSFLSGFTRVHFHVPHAHGAGGVGHGGHGGFHGTHGANGTHGHGGTAHHGSHGKVMKGGHFPFINPMTMAAFLTWFGGVGYLTEHRHWVLLTGLGVATLAGLAGASIVFWFVAKVLMAEDYTMDPADYEMVGVLGRICSGIRENGTGELLYVQMGQRRVCAARSEGGEALSKGEEVVVTKYERGVAYVRRWDDLARDHGVLPEHETQS